MSDYTVIPPEPGTSLIEVSIEIADGGEPDVSEHAILAWRIPHDPNEGHEAPIAVVFGAGERPVGATAWFVVETICVSIFGLQMPNGLICSGGRFQSRADFIQDASARLNEHLPRYLAKRMKMEV